MDTPFWVKEKAKWALESHEMEGLEQLEVHLKHQEEALEAILPLDLQYLERYTFSFFKQEQQVVINHYLPGREQGALVTSFWSTWPSGIILWAFGPKMRS
jgi:hypothetical protein